MTDQDVKSTATTMNSSPPSSPLRIQSSLPLSISAATAPCSPGPPLLQLSEDATSIGSAFQLEDFSSDTWSSVVLSYGVPTIGFIVLGIFHPFMLIAATSMAAVSYGAYQVCGEDEPQAVTPTTTEPETRTKEHYQKLQSMVSLVDEDDDEEEDVTDEPENDSERPPVSEIAISNSANVSSVGEDEEKQLPKPLKDEILTQVPLDGCGLSTHDFFLLFWGDKAAFSFEHFQHQRGDINIKYSPWNEKDERTLCFETPTKGLMSSSYAKARKVQRLVQQTETAVVLEATTYLDKIPFSDRFVVDEQWVLAQRDGGTIHVTVTAQVKFLASCGAFIENQIQSKAMATLKEVLGSWKDMARIALKTTRMRRQQQQRLQLEFIDADGIEVEYDEPMSDKDWEGTAATASETVETVSTKHSKRRRNFTRLFRRPPLARAVAAQ